MRSYVEILDELCETIDSDNIPNKTKENAKKKIRELFQILWEYSD